MAVKGKRYRYIGFEIIDGEEIDRREMIRAVRNSFREDEYTAVEPWITVFTGDKGIVRCLHTGKDRTIEILNNLEIKGGTVKTVVTSGTIKKVKKVLLEG